MYAENYKDQGEKGETRQQPWVHLENRNTSQDLVKSLYNVSDKNIWADINPAGRNYILS